MTFSCKATLRIDPTYLQSIGVPHEQWHLISEHTAAARTVYDEEGRTVPAVEFTDAEGNLKALVPLPHEKSLAETVENILWTRARRRIESAEDPGLRENVHGVVVSTVMINIQLARVRTDRRAIGRDIVMAAANIADIEQGSTSMWRICLTGDSVRIAVEPDFIRNATDDVCRNLRRLDGVTASGEGERETFTLEMTEQKLGRIALTLNR